MMLCCVVLELNDCFKQVYNSVNDIDLITGGLAETPLPGAIIGKYFLIATLETSIKL